MNPSVCGKNSVYIPETGCTDCSMLEGRVETLEHEYHVVENQMATKMEPSNIIAGNNITVTRSGNNVTINSVDAALDNYYTKQETDDKLALKLDATKTAILSALGYSEIEIEMTDTDGTTRTWQVIGRIKP